ncbi:hypothetical protein ACVNIS_24735 (plasmid) [Sphaerotilaceae bacterium SBD11-9]
MNDTSNIRTLGDLEAGDVGGAGLTPAEEKRAKVLATVTALAGIGGAAWTLYGGPRGAAYVGAGLVIGAIAGIIMPTRKSNSTHSGE